MRVILDHSVPNKLRSFLPEHSVETAYERGWAALKNGELLKAIAGEGFQVFVTADQNLRHQQNLSSIPFGIIVLGTNIWPLIAAHPAKVASAVAAAGAGQVAYVEYPRPPLVRRPQPN
ncbi:MAG: hypothetical protein ACRYG8_06940 [Janthinobacterium lividum]